MSLQHPTASGRVVDILLRQVSHYIVLVANMKRADARSTRCLDLLPGAQKRPIENAGLNRERIVCVLDRLGLAWLRRSSAHDRDEDGDEDAIDKSERDCRALQLSALHRDSSM